MGEGETMRLKCKMCGWEGITELKIEEKDGVKILYAVCPKCGADLYCKTLNGEENVGKK